MTDEAAAIDLATRFFAAIERGDVAAVEAIYAPDAVIWHNDDGQETDRATNLILLRGFVARTVSRAYRDRILQPTPTGFVQQHVLVAERPDGRRLEMAVCIVCRVEHGRIVRLDEYLDSAALAGWFDPA